MRATVATQKKTLTLLLFSISGNIDQMIQFICDFLYALCVFQW